MADNPYNPSPGPSGAVPPPKKETGKVQPKKETVRINLPPKPTAAPTIKLPTLPPGGPTGAPSAAPILAPAPPVAPPKTSTQPAASAGKVQVPSPQQRPASMQRPAASPSPSIKTIDKVLVYTAAFAAIVGVGLNAYVFFGVLKPLIENFQP